jgi:DNA-binding transcriptional ArsR family regulator
MIHGKSPAKTARIPVETAKVPTKTAKVPAKKSKRRIGTENESSLHRALKFRYADPGKTEEERAGFVCDALGPGGEAIEIQTRNFGALKNKLPALAARGRTRLVYPVIVNKTIELYDTDGSLISKRKSPRKGGVWDIFGELIYAPKLALLRRLTVEIALVDATERRRDDGLGSWRRKGISIEDRRLDAFRESIVLQKKADWRRFLPVTGEFTVKELANSAKIRPVLARKTLYVLEKAGLVEKVRKEGRSWVYKSR